MSLGCVGRVIYQGGMRVAVGMKEQASKCDPTLKSLRDSACSSSSSSSSTQARRFSAALDSAAFKVVKNAEERLKQSEESLRTVMYLSCWGPN